MKNRRNPRYSACSTSRHQITCLVSLALLCLNIPASGNGDRINPFVRPLKNHVEATLSSGSAPELELRAVVSAGKVPLANINGKVLAVGERYLDFQITHIAKDHITMIKIDQHIELHLWQAEEDK